MPANLLEAYVTGFVHLKYIFFLAKFLQTRGVAR